MSSDGTQSRGIFCVISVIYYTYMVMSDL